MLGMALDPNDEAAAVDPDHHRQFCAPAQRSQDARRLRNRQSSDEVGDIAPAPGPKARLRTVRAELAGIAHALPCGQRLRRAPAIFADGRRSKGNALEAGDISFGHAAHGAVVRFEPLAPQLT